MRNNLHVPISERAWQTQLVQLAHLHGWRTFHVLNPKGMTAGWPDLVLLRPPELVFAELKREHGRVTAAQTEVLAMLEACGQEVHVWRPSDFDAVHTRLNRREHR